MFWRCYAITDSSVYWQYSYLLSTLFRNLANILTVLCCHRQFRLLTVFLSFIDAISESSQCFDGVMLSQTFPSIDSIPIFYWRYFEIWPIFWRYYVITDSSLYWRYTPLSTLFFDCVTLWRPFTPSNLTIMRISFCVGFISDYIFFKCWDLHGDLPLCVVFWRRSLE